MWDKEEYICDECFKCYYYWQNDDTGYECQGDEEPCHEFIKIKEVKEDEC